MKDGLLTSDEIPIISIKASDRFLSGLHPFFLEILLKFLNDKMAPVNA